MTLIRPPQIDLAVVLTQQSPQIDLRLAAYDAATRHFLKSVTNFKNRAISVISDRRNTQAGEIKRVAEKIGSVESETNACKLREIELLKVIEKEQEERKDAELAVAAFRRQLSTLREKCAAIDGEIEQYRALTSNLLREKNKERSSLIARSSRFTSELCACESPLKCKVEGIEKDQLLIRFSHIDETDLDREFSFVLDVTTRVYRVLTTTPLLPKLPILVEALNVSRDVYVFIRHMRIMFQELVKTGQ